MYVENWGFASEHVIALVLPPDHLGNRVGAVSGFGLDSLFTNLQSQFGPDLAGITFQTSPQRIATANQP